MEINEYDLWFAHYAGRDIRRILQETGAEDPGEIYDSNAFPRWKRDLDRFRRGLLQGRKKEIRMLRLTDPEYPARLKEIHDPPWVLYVRGKLPDPDRLCCAIVGSRKATAYGLRMAFAFGKILGQHGVNVISGMALGADGQGHRGCLSAGGYTAAVLGSGADVCAPSSHRSLMEEILASGGGIVSEQMPGTPGMPEHYPLRNRIISGMSDAVIVVEADERSGTSITASMALEQGREVYALPGNITSVMSRGTNRLIREGATPLISVESILWELGLGSDITAAETPAPALGKDEEILWRTLKRTGISTMDELCGLTGKTPGELAGLLSVMEIKGLVLRNGGKIMIAN